jgi:hypothetical protein
MVPEEINKPKEVDVTGPWTSCEPGYSLWNIE